MSSVSYVYNDAGLIASTTESSVGGPTVTLAYQYNDAGQRTQMAATIDGTPDFVDDYTYDSLGRVVTVTERGVTGGNAVAQKEIDITYSDAGQIASIDRYQDGQLAVEADYSYDALGRLVGLVYHQGDTVLSSYTWTYSGSSDSLSLIPNPQSLISSSWTPTGGLMPIHDTTGVTDALMSGGLAGLDVLTSCTSAEGSATYSYDPTGQLIAAHYSLPPLVQGPAVQPDESYSYDANGNRTNPGYVVGADNRLLSDGTYTYWYGAEGNRTARFIDANGDGVLDAGDTEVTEYMWDARDRLAQVTDYAIYGGSPTQIVNYLYDAENRWIGEAIDSNGDGTIDRQIRFAYDGNQIVLEFDRSSPLPLGEGQGEGSPLTACDLSHRYLWDPSVVDHVLADEQFSPLQPGEGQGEGFDLSTPGAIVWPLADNLGTVRDLAVHDAQTGATAVLSHRIYDSFGNLRSKSGALDCLFGFTGRALDAATGLQNNLHRWYDAHAGLWMSEDPTGFAAGDTNLHRYVGNGPTCATDPTGLDSSKIPLIEAKAIVAEALRHGHGLKELTSSEYKREGRFGSEGGVDGMEGDKGILKALGDAKYDVLFLKGHAHEGHRITLGDQHRVHWYTPLWLFPTRYKQYALTPENSFREGAKLKGNLADNAVIVIASCYLGLEAMRAQENHDLSVAQQVADGAGVQVLTPCYACDGGPEAPIPDRTRLQVATDLEKRGLIEDWMFTSALAHDWVLTTPNPIT